MARPRDVLARFRPAGAPGSAAAAGVPADRLAELDVELGPVLDRLASAQRRAAAVRSAADAEATRRRRDGEARAAAVVKAAREQAAAERLALAGRARADGDTAVAEAVTAAQAEASAMADRVARRLPGLLDRVRAAVRTELLPDPGTGHVSGPDRPRAGAR